MTALTFANFVSAEGFMLGDVNGNSKIDTLDSLKILKHVANIEKLTEAEQKAADCDENGTINSVDALKILKSIVGLEPFKCFAQPASVFANNMVLQREEKVPVWGYAEDGRIVKVSFNGQEKQTVAKDGKWMIYLDPMEANKTPQNMTIMSTGTHVVKNILVGEVWFAGGQSNMAFQIGILGDPTLKNNIINDCAYPEIRVFTQNEVRSETPQKFNKGSKWTASSKATVSGFSVMGYLLARDLHKELNVPVGIITSAYGGTNIEDHINNKVLEESGLDVIYGGASTFKNNAYNAMLAPLFPFKVKGAIWYQGENNSAPEMAAKNYSSYLKLYVEQLRAGFENENMNFVQVQLPSFGSADFPDMRYYQMEGDDKIPNVYTVPAYDTGLEKDIHPSDKGPIAQRIKNTVLNKVYNKTQYTCVYPKADTFTQQDDNSLLVTFKQNVELEVVKEDANTLFVCDENGIYHQAKAQVVDGTKLKITTDKFTGKIYGVKYASEPMVKTAHIVTKNGKDLIMPFKWESLPEIPDVKKDIDMTYDFKTIADYNKYSTSYKFNYNDGFTGYPSVDNPTHQIGPVV
ncbi:MAG: sialate O-acetylesterase, partial [Clostridia bacterium]